MKKYILTIFLASLNHVLFAQWVNSTNSNNINNTNSGNVGIGTSTPNDKLTIRDTNIPYDSASGLVKLSFDSGAGFGGIGFEKETFNTGGLRFFTQYGYSSTAERMRITGNGNVGIGTTNPQATLSIKGSQLPTSQWANYTSSLQLGELVIQDYNTVPQVGLGQNMYFDGANYKYILNGYASQMYMGQNGNITFSVYNNGTSGNAITGTGVAMTIQNGGNIGIGTTVPDQKLTVNGTIHASQVKVDTQIPQVPDYVFKKDYNLIPLSALKNYLDKNQHLPEIPSASEQEKEGLDLGKMNQLLLRKVEELTLYLIEKDKKDKALEAKVSKLTSEMIRLKKSKN